MKTAKFAREGNHKCQNCDKTWDAAKLKGIADIHQRVAPGEPVPSGECPECGALCQPATENKALDYMLRNDGCPHCHGFCISGGPVEIDGNVASQTVDCENCGAAYELKFKLVDVITVEGGDGEEAEDEEDGEEEDGEREEGEEEWL